MAAPDDEFCACLKRNFIGIGSTMEAQTTVSNSTQCGLFIGKYKKYTLSELTFSFNPRVSLDVSWVISLFVAIIRKLICFRRKAISLSSFLLTERFLLHTPPSNSEVQWPFSLWNWVQHVLKRARTADWCINQRKDPLLYQTSRWQHPEWHCGRLLPFSCCRSPL